MYTIKRCDMQPIKESIKVFCNTGSNYKPASEFSICYSDKGFHVHFDVHEKNPRTTCSQNFELVCLDSCVEWFVTFAPNMCDRYFNFEINSAGTIDAAFRKDRYEFVKLTEDDVATLDIKTNVQPEVWTVDFTVPFDFIRKYIKDYNFGDCKEIRANVYKCCGSNDFRHSACWSEIKLEKPDFHKPEFFGTMIIE